MSRNSKPTKISSRKALQLLQEDMVKQTHFNKDEIDSLLKKFNCQLPNNKVAHDGKAKLDRASFKDFLQKELVMTDDLMMDRVFKAFDKDNDSKISAEEWCLGMSVLLRGTPEEEADFAFEIYNVRGGGNIAKDEIFQLLKGSLHFKIGEDEADEGEKDLVDMAMKKLDVDADNQVSRKDYGTSVKEDPMLTICLGPWKPSDKHIQAFEQTLHN